MFFSLKGTPTVFKVSAFWSINLTYYFPLEFDTIKYTPTTKSIIPIIISFPPIFIRYLSHNILCFYRQKKKNTHCFSSECLSFWVFILYFTIHLQTATVNKITDAAIIAIKI